jgi:hypothetical protein
MYFVKCACAQHLREPEHALFILILPRDIFEALFNASVCSLHMQTNHVKTQI